MTQLTVICIYNPDWFVPVEQLEQNLQTWLWADKILLVTSRQTKSLSALARRFGCDLALQTGDNYAQWRWHAVQLAQTDWVLFVDADEQVSEPLAQEIQQLLVQPDQAGYAIPRLNYLLGQPLRHGGYWPDYVLRLLYKPALKGFDGALHEQPQLTGGIGYLHQPLLHFKHQKIEEMVTKTNQWSATEADLMKQANHPVMNVRRFLRPMVTEFVTRYLVKSGWRDGTVGLIDAVYQTFSRFISYAKLYEMQVQSDQNKV